MAQETLADRSETGGPTEERHRSSTTPGETFADALAGARDEAVGEAKTLGQQASDEVRAQADAAKDEAAAGLNAFSDALKAARSELSGQKLGFAGDMVTQAADGLENFARALEGRSSGEMLEAVRDFGRRNPVGFIAGSVLAGFALGRVAAAGTAAPTPSAPASAASSPSASGTPSWPAAEHGPGKGAP